MGALDTAKEFVRIGSTAGLSKDVIDLLEKKAALLADQVATLEQENTTLLRENRNLTSENQQLKTQLQNTRPKGDGLTDKTKEILVFFFKNAHFISQRQIAQHFRLEMNVAVYHLDLLCDKGFIEPPGAIGIYGGFGSEDYINETLTYEITSAGRKYVVENGLTG